MSQSFGAAYTLANYDPASNEYFPTQKPLTPFKAAQCLSQGQPSGVFKDPAGYWVLTTGDEFKTLKLQKATAEYAKTNDLDSYVQQAAQGNLNTLKTAIGLNAGFVDTTDIENNPNQYPADGAQLPAGMQPALDPLPPEDQPARPTMTAEAAAAPLLASLLAPGTPANQIQAPTVAQLTQLLGQSPFIQLQAPDVAAPFTLEGQPISTNQSSGTQPVKVDAVTVNPQLTAIAQQAAQDLARTLVKQFNDDNTTVKVNVSIAQVQPTEEATPSQNPLDTMAVGQTLPVPMAPTARQSSSASTSATTSANPFESVQIGLPPVSLADMLSPFGQQPATNPTTNGSVAQSPQTLPLSQIPSSNTQF
jgi:hypothetical protein